MKKNEAHLILKIVLGILLMFCFNLIMKGHK